MVARYSPLHGKAVIQCDDGELVLFADYEEAQLIYKDQIRALELEMAKLRHSFNALADDWRTSHGK